MEQLISPLLDIMNEVYIGTEEKHSWVIDAKPGNGFGKTIRSLTAQEASTSAVPGGTTVAAHTGHLKWGIEFALQFYEGKRPQGNWEESWLIKTVNEAEWEQLQQEFLSAYTRLKDTIVAVKDWSDPYMIKGTLALLPHAAYHLGAIKQLIIMVKN